VASRGHPAGPAVADGAEAEVPAEEGASAVGESVVVAEWQGPGDAAEPAAPPSGSVGLATGSDHVE